MVDNQVASKAPRQIGVIVEDKTGITIAVQAGTMVPITVHGPGLESALHLFETTHRLVDTVSSLAAFRPEADTASLRRYAERDIERLAAVLPEWSAWLQIGGSRFETAPTVALVAAACALERTA